MLPEGKTMYVSLACYRIYVVTVLRSIWFLIDRRIVNDGDRRDLVAQGCARWWLFLFCTHIWTSVFQEPSRWGRHITLTLEDPG